jgi:hypothetical protein
VSVTGPISPVIWVILKRIPRRELPATVDKLIVLAERT